jgi:hypothetical protein
MSTQSVLFDQQRTRPLPLHCESVVQLPVPAPEVFAHLDDHQRLASHMSKSSWMMAGSKMSLEMDAAAGKTEGSRIRLSGTVLGIRLSVDEVVTERRPPLHKAWVTEGEPKLLVVGPYRMGFDIEPRGESSSLRVFIDYAAPDNWLGRWLPSLGKFYARWCTEQMTNDCAKHFSLSSGN